MFLLLILEKVASNIKWHTYVDYKQRKSEKQKENSIIKLNNLLKAGRNKFTLRRFSNIPQCTINSLLVYIILYSDKYIALEKGVPLKTSTLGDYSLKERYLCLYLNLTKTNYGLNKHWVGLVWQTLYCI